MNFFQSGSFDSQNVKSFLGVYGWSQHESTDREREEEEKEKVLDSSQDEQEEDGKKPLDRKPLNDLDKFFDQDSNSFIGNDSPADQGDLDRGADLLQQLKDRDLCYPPIIAGACFSLDGDEGAAKEKMAQFLSEGQMSQLQSEELTQQNMNDMLIAFAENILQLANEHGDDYVRDLESKHIDSLKQNNQESERKSGEVESEAETGTSEKSANKVFDGILNDLKSYFGIGGRGSSGNDPDDDMPDEEQQDDVYDIPSDLTPEERDMMERIKNARKEESEANEEEKNGAKNERNEAEKGLKDHFDKESMQSANTASAIKTRQESEAKTMTGSAQQAVDSNKKPPAQGAKSNQAKAPEKQSWVNIAQNVPSGYSQEAENAMRRDGDKK